MTTRNGTLYPITIVQTRYGGIYEGGKWAAFHLHPECLPDGAFGGDTDCMYWWDDNRDTVGLGDTPDEALNSLIDVTP